MILDELLKEIKTKSLKEQISLVCALFETQKEFDNYGQIVIYTDVVIDENSQEYRLRLENDYDYRPPS